MNAPFLISQSGYEGGAWPALPGGPRPGADGLPTRSSAALAGFNTVTKETWKRGGWGRLLRRRLGRKGLLIRSAYRDALTGRWPPRIFLPAFVEERARHSDGRVDKPRESSVRRSTTCPAEHATPRTARWRSTACTKRWTISASVPS